MGDYVNRMLREGWDFPQFAAACTQAMAVEHTYREVSPFNDAEIAGARERIALMDDFAAKLGRGEYGRQLQVKRLNELKGNLRRTWEATVRVEAMRHHVEAWEPGENEATRGLKRFMLAELDRGPDAQLLKIHEKGIAAIEAMTPTAYLDSLYEDERRTIANREEDKETEAARAAEWRAWREALAAAGIPEP